MSKVKIQGHASGSGVLTITAPNTSTDRTITLPDTTGTLLDENSSVPAANLTGTVADARFPATLPAASAANLTAIPAANITGTLPAISGANLTGLSSGLSGADMWRLTANFSSNSTITNNLERVDDANFSKIGTGMSTSGGAWTFPETGIWLVRCNWGAEINGVSDPFMDISTSSDSGSSWDEDGKCYAGSVGSGWMKINTSAEIIFDVTNVSTHKIRFRIVNANSSVLTQADTNRNWTYFTFLRLGDT